MSALVERMITGNAAPAAADDTRDRILEAALRQFEDFGIRRTTMDDVARRAGVSRVTVYRRFPQKERLVEAVVLNEAQRFFAALESAVAPHEGVEARMVEGFAFTLAAARRHALLNRLLRTEPEALLPYLTIEGAPVLTAARRFLAAQMKAGQEVVAELVVRLVLSYLLTPDSAVPLRTSAQARAFARRYIAPLVTGARLGGE